MYKDEGENRGLVALYDCSALKELNMRIMENIFYPYKSVWRSHIPHTIPLSKKTGYLIQPY